MSRPAEDAAEIPDVARERHEEVAALLARAFEDDPGYRYVTGASGAAHRGAMRDLQGRALEIHLAQDLPRPGLVEAGRLRAVALVEPPSTSISYRAVARVAPGVVARLGPAVGLRALRMILAMERLRPELPHHRLAMIAVDAPDRGRGLARTLLEDLHARCARDPVSTGVGLETTKPENVPLYERFGYRVTHADHFAGVPVWSLFRARS